MIEKQWTITCREDCYTKDKDGCLYLIGYEQGKKMRKNESYYEKFFKNDNRCITFTPNTTYKEDSSIELKYIGYSFFLGFFEDGVNIIEKESRNKTQSRTARTEHCFSCNDLKKYFNSHFSFMNECLTHCLEEYIYNVYYYVCRRK